MTGIAEKETPGAKTRFSRWFAAAILLSLAAHLFLMEKAKRWHVPGFSAESYDEIVPRTFRMKRVEIDPATLEEPAVKPTPAPRERREVEIPEERPALEAADGTAGKRGGSLKPPAELPRETPASGTVPALMETTDGLTRKPLAEIMENLSSQPAMDDPLRDEALKIPGKSTAQEGVPGFSSLDDLLEGKQPVGASTAPILMPTDLLFEYDSSTLRPEAAESLRKLGTIIARNGGARFRIEGHTDSFGSDDYNTALSLRRAEGVREWLRREMGLDAARIETAGYGKTRLLVPGTGTIAAQRLNRRVEIVITEAK